MGSKVSMPMELFSVGLSSSSAICLYELLHCVMWSRDLDDWYVVLSLFVGLVHAVYILGNTFHHQGPIVSFYIPCKYSSSLGRCYDDLDKFVYLQIVPLLLCLYHSPVEVFHYDSSCVMLVMLICCGRFPGLIVAESRLVLCLANPLLLQLVVVKQGLRFS